MQYMYLINILISSTNLINYTTALWSLSASCGSYEWDLLVLLLTLCLSLVIFHFYDIFVAGTEQRSSTLRWCFCLIRGCNLLVIYIMSTLQRTDLSLVVILSLFVHQTSNKSLLKDTGLVEWSCFFGCVGWSFEQNVSCRSWCLYSGGSNC